MISMEESTKGLIKQLKQQLKHCVKGTKYVDEFMQHIKIKADALVLFGSPIHLEDLIDAVLDGSLMIFDKLLILFTTETL